MNLLVVAAAREAGSAELVARLAPQHDLVLAVDGGGAICLEAGISPDIVLGDFDSLKPEDLERLRAGGAQIVSFPAEKDQTDLELAIAEARRVGADSLTLTAASSGRLDHTLAALGALAGAVDLRPALIEPQMDAWVLGEAGRNQLRVSGVGSTISLIALGGDARVSVTGTHWPLEDAVLPPGSGRGVSNVVESEDGAVVDVLAGTLLVIAPK